MLALVATIALAAAAASAQADDDAVDREIALRRVAVPLAKRLSVEVDGELGVVTLDDLTAEVDRVLPECEPWVRRFAALDAAARVGLLVSRADGKALVPDERPEILALQVRTLAIGSDPESFARALGDALASPFAGVRDAALDRLARALATDARVDPFLRPLAERKGIDVATLGELALTFARAGATSKERVEAATSAYVRSRGPSGIRTDGAPAIGPLLDEWLPRPLTAAGLEGFEHRATVQSWPEQSVALVASSRDGVVRNEGSDGPDVDALALFLQMQADPETVERIAQHARSMPFGFALAGWVENRMLPPEKSIAFARGAAWSLPFGTLLTDTRAFDEDAALEVWDVIGLREDLMPAGPLAFWLEDERDAVRETAARELGRRVVTDPPTVAPKALVTLLDDPSSELRSLAFSWLAEGWPYEEIADALRVAFDAEAIEGEALSDRQRRWLARLPRDVAVPAFRDVVLQLVADPVTRDPAIVELLGLYVRDAEVDALLRRCLEEELVALEAAPGFLERRGPDGLAASVVRALMSMGGEETVPAIVDALERSMVPMNGGASRGDARPQLPKTCCGLLQRFPFGRDALVGFLRDEVPRRVRFEAALQLAKTVPLDLALAPRLGARLVADFDGVDGTLRIRAIDALARLGRAEDPVVDAFLGAVARGERGDDAERLAAVAALGRRGALQLVLAVARRPLERGASSLIDLEAAVAAARALGDDGFASAEIPTARATLGVFRQVEARLADDGVEELERDALDQMRGTLLVSLCRGLERRGFHLRGPTYRGPRLEPEERDEIAAAIARRPSSAARGDIASRFRGASLGDARFRWSTEIEAIGLLQNTGVVPPLDADVDARLLLVLGDQSVRGRAHGPPVEWNLRTGLFGVEGEPRTRESGRDLAFGRVALVEAHRAAARSAVREDGLAGRAADAWNAAALETIRLLVDVRRGRVRSTILESMFGVADPAVPRSAEARLAALSYTLRARAVLAGSEDVAAARAFADAARPWARLDKDAARDLAEVDAEIAEREGR